MSSVGLAAASNGAGKDSKINPGDRALFNIPPRPYLAGYIAFEISVLNGIAFSLAISARQALISGLVHRGQLRTAVGLSATTYNSAQIIGPAVGGPFCRSLALRGHSA